MKHDYDDSDNYDDDEADEADEADEDVTAAGTVSPPC